MKADNRKVPKRIAQTVLNSLKGGVVPRIGLPYIAVGRKNEIEALLHDVDIIAEGGASFRFIVGRYGSGKSFLLQTIRNYVMDRGFIVADADLSPERRLHGTRGQGLATYRELIGNLSTKTKPEGGALTLVLDRWISSVQAEAAGETGLEPGDPALTKAVDQKIYTVTSAVSELVHGFEFARLLSLYYHAYLDGDDETKARVTRWFRGEYTLKREAKEELGVNILITDDDWSVIVQLDDETAEELSESETSTIKVRIDKDSETLNADFSLIQRGGKYYGCLEFNNSMIRYAEDRYLNIELILEDESGLKIPKTAVVTRNFSIVPRDYLTTGGNGSSTGVLLLDDDGNAVFKEIDIYNISEDDEVYVSLSDIKTGDVLIKPESSETYSVDDTKTLEGVYNINRGYAVFRKVTVLCENDEYCIVQEGEDYGLSNYDHIVQNGSSVEPDEVVY